jgi:hypothetical protein
VAGLVDGVAPSRSRNENTAPSLSSVTGSGGGVGATPAAALAALMRPFSRFVMPFDARRARSRFA